MNNWKTSSVTIFDKLVLGFIKSLSFLHVYILKCTSNVFWSKSMILKIKS